MGDILSLDCVPCKWVTYDAVRATCVCKFMPPPYNKTTRAKLGRLIIAQSNAPEEWLCYPVHLRGQAETYQEGQDKLKKLNSERAYVYSTDNEDHAKEKSAYFTKMFAEKSKKNQKMNLDAIMYGSDIEESSDTECEDSSAESINDDGDAFVGNKRASAKNISSVKKPHPCVKQPNTGEMDGLNMKSKKCSVDSEKYSPTAINTLNEDPKSTKPSYSDKVNSETNGFSGQSRKNTGAVKKTLPTATNVCDNEPEKTRPSSSHKENSSLSQKSRTNTETLTGKSPKATNAMPSSSARVIYNANMEKTSNSQTEDQAPRNTQRNENRPPRATINIEDPDAREITNFSKDTLLIHSALKALTVEVQMQGEQIRQLRNCIDRTLKIRVSGMTVEDFAMKHDVVLKINSLQALKDFETKLSMNEQCLKDFMESLKHYVEDDMHKTILAIFKKILEREVAMQCTAVRDSKNKFNMKDTTFCKTVFELVCKNCTYDSGKLVTEKNFNKALGSVFNNAKDWDGQRNVRRLVNHRMRQENNNDVAPPEQ